MPVVARRWRLGPDRQDRFPRARGNPASGASRRGPPRAETLTPGNPGPYTDTSQLSMSDRMRPSTPNMWSGEENKR